jgi:hypothetical protein
MGVVRIVLDNIGFAGTDQHSDETGACATQEEVSHGWSPQLMM